MADLEHLAQLVEKRNTVATQIAGLIDRPAQLRHVGQYIAAGVFGIELEEPGEDVGWDGRFGRGPLAGKTVKVEWYPKREGVLEIPAYRPDYILVMAGPETSETTSRGTTRPWVISEVFLFDVKLLVSRLTSKPGPVTTVGAHEWDAARIYPEAPLFAPVALSPKQIESLRRFASE